jgi:hypothetical protein
MRRHPILFQPLVSHYLDQRFTLAERFAAYAHDLEFSATRIHRAFPNFFRGSIRQPMWADNDSGYSIELTLNLTNPSEGLWRVILTDQSGRGVFFACFSVLPGPHIFIGAIQGGNSGSGADPLTSIRAATKQFAGLRPQCLLLHVLSSIATAWRVNRIIGVSNQNQLTNKTKRRKRAAIRFCYDTYFLESRADASPCGNWDVPLRLPEKAIEDIPSRKRAMYRRRSVIVCNVREQIESTLSVPLPGEQCLSSSFGINNSE